MPDTCTIVSILTVLSLMVNIVVCFYTLYLAKKSEHRHFNEGYIHGFIDSADNTNALLRAGQQPQSVMRTERSIKHDELGSTVEDPAIAE